jgi:hypothetical protein
LTRSDSVRLVQSAQEFDMFWCGDTITRQGFCEWRA